MRQKKRPQKKTNQDLLTKDEWEKLDEENTQKVREKGKKMAKKRKKPVTIAFRTSISDREKIYNHIALSGLPKQTYMTDAILHAPVRIVASQHVIDRCYQVLSEILEEMSKGTSYDEMDEVLRDEFVFVMKIMEAALEKRDENGRREKKKD